MILGLYLSLSLLNKQEEALIELLSQDFKEDYRHPSIKNLVATTLLISFGRIRRSICRSWRA